MNRKEIAKASRLLRSVGRVSISTISDYRGEKPTLSLFTDGDGRKQPFGTPIIFGSFDQVREYVDGKLSDIRKGTYGRKT